MRSTVFQRRGISCETLSYFVFTELATTYRIKLTGFLTPVTPEYLAQLLNQKLDHCFVERKNTHVGYILKVKSMRYARRLMNKLHNQQIEEHHLKCQLELDPVLPTSRMRSPTPTDQRQLSDRGETSSS